jgi:hypothetical protein
MVSPSFPYSCPPPPYSHPPSTSSAHSGQSGLVSPPVSRRTSGDEPAPIQPTRQSLPSIHEALGGSDPALSYSAQTSAPPASAPAFYQPPATSSVSDLHRRSFTAGPPPSQEPHHSFSHPSPHSPFTSRTPQVMHAPHTPSSTADILSRPPLYAPQQHPKLPTLQPIRTGNSPVTALRPSLAYQSQQPSPAYDSHPASQSAPATAQYGSGFSQFPQSSTYSFNPPTPSTAYPGTAPPRYPPGPPTWRQDSGARPEERQPDTRMGGMPPLPYHESVKRHLDNFDLEASLNEVRRQFYHYLFDR